MSQEGLNQTKLEEFGGRALDILNKASLAVMMSVGHRTGLFETMATLPPSTTHEIAGAAGLQERYVREWLGAMVTGHIVDHDRDAATYSLPPEHAAFLTPAAQTNNIANFAQLIPLIGNVEDEIVECFRRGGGRSLLIVQALSGGDARAECADLRFPAGGQAPTAGVGTR